MDGIQCGLPKTKGITLYVLHIFANRPGMAGTVPECWALSGDVPVGAKYIQCPGLTLVFHSLVLWPLEGLGTTLGLPLA